LLKKEIKMEFLDLAKKRYSVRSYKETKVEKEKLESILKAGQVAPTGANKQPHHLLVVQSDEGMTKIGKTANIHGAPLAIIVCENTDEAWERPFDKKNLADIDTSIVTDHMMLQATAEDLGSLWVCYFDPKIIKEEFSIPDHLEAISILAIGYADGKVLSPDRHEQARKPLSETVSYESF